MDGVAGSNDGQLLFGGVARSGDAGGRALEMVGFRSGPNGYYLDPQAPSPRAQRLLLQAQVAQLQHQNAALQREQQISAAEYGRQLQASLQAASIDFEAARAQAVAAAEAAQQDAASARARLTEVSGQMRHVPPYVPLGSIFLILDEVNGLSAPKITKITKIRKMMTAAVRRFVFTAKQGLHATSKPTCSRGPRWIPDEGGMVGV